MADRVKVEINDGVADVRLSRADKMNALDAEMFEALIETGSSLAQNAAVRAVVLSGEGKGFCAGLDVASFMQMSAQTGERGGGLLRREGNRPANRAQQAAFAWFSMPVPVIAAVHGVAFGGGLQIALGADIRFVTADTRLSVMEIKWGLIPDMTGPQMLRHLVRLDVAKELTYTGRIVSGSEAVQLGLATHVSENPHADATTMARDIAGKSPDAIRGAKKVLQEVSYLGLEEGLRLEESLQLSLIGTPNQMEAVQANFEKRDPDFIDPE